MNKFNFKCKILLICIGLKAISSMDCFRKCLFYTEQAEDSESIDYNKKKEDERIKLFISNCVSRT